MTAREHSTQSQGTTRHHGVWARVAKALQMWSDKWDWARSPRDRPPAKPPTGPGIIVMPVSDVPDDFDITSVVPSGPPAPERCPHCGAAPPKKAEQSRGGSMTHRTVTFPAAMVQHVANELCDQNYSLPGDEAELIAQDIVIDVTQAVDKLRKDESNGEIGTVLGIVCNVLAKAGDELEDCPDLGPEVEDLQRAVDLLKPLVF